MHYYLLQAYRFLLLFLCLSSFAYPQTQSGQAYFQWTELPSLPAISTQTEALGVAGPVAGVHNGALIVAGGANFDKPYWDNEKAWHQDIWILEKFQTENRSWRYAGSLQHPLAYSAVVSTKWGIVAMGGADANHVFDEVRLLSWDSDKQEVKQEFLPPLPTPCAYGSATLIGNTIYLAGGMSSPGLETAMDNFLGTG